MAYVLGFPKDVTDLISGMRDWRWEMVRDGGKTPSASCVNPCPPHGIGEAITTNMEPGKEYLTTCCMPEFSSWGTYCVPHYEFHPDSFGAFPSWGIGAGTTIKLWKFIFIPSQFPSYYSGRHEWKVIHTWSPHTTPGVGEKAVCGCGTRRTMA
jgi:hypothetical protein